jgi:NitT/TauT family transport system substrate-binding protein
MTENLWTGGRRRRRGIALLAATMLVVLAACGSDGGTSSSSTADTGSEGTPAGELTHVALQMHFLPEPAWGIHLYGIEHGIYEAHGIDLEMIPGQGSNFTMQQLNENQVQFGSASTIAYLANRAEVGEGTTAVLAVIKEPQAGILTTVEADSLDDLVGTSVGMIPFSVSQVLLPVVLAENGLPADAITIEPVTYSFGLLFEGEVDGLEAHYGGNVATAEKAAAAAGVDVWFVALKDQGLVGHPQGLIVRDDVIEENPDLVRSMVAAMVESIQGAMAAPPEEIAALVAERAPELSEEDIVAEWADLVPLMNETGEIDETVIETELGYVSEALGITHDLTTDQVYTNEFLP